MVSASRNLEKLNILKKSEYIFGIRPIEEALEQGKVIEKLLFQKNLQGEASRRLLQKAKQHRVPVQQVPLVALNKITHKNHQGVIAYLSPIDYQSLRSEEHTSELQSHAPISYAVFCLKKKK